jgi:GrpB-like predicted nucleotidyltransferase (UPF0157 family)
MVSEYDPRWPEWFDRICARIWPADDGIAVRIEHIGSTAVPVLAAKPIIDSDIVVASEVSIGGDLIRLSGVGPQARMTDSPENKENHEVPVDDLR